MLVNNTVMQMAVVRTAPVQKDRFKPKFEEDLELALESPHELEDLIEDVLRRMPQVQAGVVRLAYGLTEEGRALALPEISTKMGITEGEAALLLTGGLQILGMDPKLAEVFHGVFVH